MPTDKQEYDYGLKSEIRVKPILEKYFGKALHATDKWDPFDFVGENIKVELKSRRNNRGKYPTTIVGQNKVDKIIDGDEIYFVFKFWDGLFYWKYEEDNNFEVSMIQRRDRPHVKPKPYLNIPVGVLKKID